MTTTYLERLAARSEAVGSVLCLGLDPDPARLPDGFPATVAGVERFVRLVVEAAGPFAAAMWDPLESTCRHASLSIL